MLSAGFRKAETNLFASLPVLRRQVLRLPFSTVLHRHLLKYHRVGSKIVFGACRCAGGQSWQGAAGSEPPAFAVPSQPDTSLLRVNCLRHQLTVDLFSKGSAEGAFSALSVDRFLSSATLTFSNGIFFLSKLRITFSAVLKCKSISFKKEKHFNNKAAELEKRRFEIAEAKFSCFLLLEIDSF